MAAGKVAVKAPWAAPLARFDGWMTRVESTLCAVVLLVEILSLCFWIALKGLSSTSSSGDMTGVVLRGLLTSVALGFAAHMTTRPRGKDLGDARAENRHAVATTVAVVGGLLLGRAWVGVGATYFSNLLNWFQNASNLMLFGGLSGLATRLTLWVALLGASIATSKGKHINVDVVMRFLPIKLRVPVALVGWIAGAVVCTAGAYGFYDFIAVASFKLPTATQCPDDASKTCPMPQGKKAGMVWDAVGKDVFLFRRQVALDLRIGPRVLFGADYDKSFTNADWNLWIREGGWESHFEKDDVEKLYAPADQARDYRTPAVTMPGGDEDARGILIRDFDFIFPFGLLMLAFRFLLRSLLAVTGYAKVDPDAMHEEDDMPSQEEDEARAAALVAKGGAS